MSAAGTAYKSWRARRRTTTSSLAARAQDSLFVTGALVSFVIGAFLLAAVAGFVVTGVALLVLDYELSA